ncbi:MAG TPA: DUF1499 domain-containing protein [Rhizomicrobium sp.]|jgi:hypothetical protein
MRFSNLVARLSFAAMLVSVAIALAAGFGTRAHLWNYHVGLLTVFPFCIYAGLAGLGLGLVWLLGAVLRGSADGARFGLIGLLGSIALLWIPLRDLYLVRIEHAIPPIHDISTDTEHAPEFVALRDNRRGATTSPDYDGPKPVSFQGRTYTTESLQKLYYGDIKSVSLLGTTPAKLFHRALSAAQAMNWDIVSIAPDAQGGRIEATDTTALFGLTFDIVIRVRPAGIGARLDIRSKSRVGTSDLGKNAARIRAYLKELAAT